MNKKTAFIVAIIFVTGLVTGLTSYAQTGQPPAGYEQGRLPMGEQRIRHMSERLGLSESQASKLRPIMQEYEGKIKAVNDDRSLSPDEKRNRKKSARDTADEKIRRILTPAQQQRFEQSRKMREQMGITD